MNHTPIPHKLFSSILKNMPICCVDVMFFSKDMTKTLLFKRMNQPLKGIYYSAGGRLLKDEKIIDCAKRQAFRETGIRLKNKDLKWGGVQEEIHRNSAFKNASYHAVGAYYYSIIEESKFCPNLDEQHSDFKWFSVKDKKLHPYIKSRLRKIFSHS